MISRGSAILGELLCGLLDGADGGEAGQDHLFEGFALQFRTTLFGEQAVTREPCIGGARGRRLERGERLSHGAQHHWSEVWIALNRPVHESERQLGVPGFVGCNL